MFFSHFFVTVVNQPRHVVVVAAGKESDAVRVT